MNAVFRHHPRGLTLVELMIVMLVIGVLFAIALPVLGSALSGARSTKGQTNLRNLVQANQAYALDHEQRFVPGAKDFTRHNLHRWHGERDAVDEPFDPARGPLAAYIGSNGDVLRCPNFDVQLQNADGEAGFEAGSGGYGYNNAYVGVDGIQHDDAFVVRTDKRGARMDAIRSPAKTVMFADAALCNGGPMPYSFAEPRFHPRWPSARFDPSIHFRQPGNRANVGWADGHVSSEERTFTWTSGLYPGEPAEHEIGWFGEEDSNRLFDLR